MEYKEIIGFKKESDDFTCPMCRIKTNKLIAPQIKINGTKFFENIYICDNCGCIWKIKNENEGLII